MATSRVRRGQIIAVAAMVVFAVGVASAATILSRQNDADPVAAPADDSSSEPVPLQPHGDPTESASPSASPSPSLSPSPSPTPKPPDPRVRAAQQRLTELGYYLGAIDGLAGPATSAATMAFQKVHGLSADGVLGPNTYAALDAPITPTLHGGEPNRIEVDLTRQVAYFVEGDILQRIFPISSGSGEKYRHVSGSIATSLTPVGAFRVERKISGIREAPLGILYDPMYFFRGWALHGSNHVPAYPASHGCVRMTRWDASWLAARTPIGMQVLVYGGTHVFKAGEELTKVGVTEPGGDATPTESPMPTPSEQPSTSEQPSASESPTPTPSESPSPSPDPTPEPSPSDTPSLPIDPSVEPAP